MKGRDLTEGSDKDEKSEISIRQVSLDALWSREPVTVRGNLNMLRKMVRIGRE